MNRPSPRRAPAAAARTRPPAWYTGAWFLALPLVAFYLLWRSLRQGGYRQHWGERFLGHVPAGPAHAPAPTGGPRIWVHAVSVGETRAAQPLVEQLARAHPDARFVLTHMTPTGRAAGGDLVRAFPGRIAQRYLPYDLPFAVGRFLGEARPDIGVLMETEIWPNLLHAAHARRIPVVLANARLSRRSLDKALRQRALMRGAAAAITVVGAQSEADRARIAQLYDGPIQVTGNGKFDIQPDAGKMTQGRNLRARMLAALGDRPLWLFASTREGEERLILDALRDRRAEAGRPPLLLFVPRHPQRFDDVAALLQEGGATVLRRAAWEAAWVDIADAGPAGAALAAGAAGPILLGDSMGDMALYYAMADVALIGGSLLPLGGQNLIEACACGCPVVLGPYMFNFASAAADAVAVGAARRVDDARDAVRTMDAICADALAHAEMAAAAQAFANAHRGATARTVTLIEASLARVGPASVLQ
jgi:3-deoxy-D-manno-octulosonic-acid transferase